MRIISRLDIKTDILIKSIQFDGVRKIGNPEEYADKYFKKGVDEVFLINNTGTLYNTKLSRSVVQNVRSKISIPIAGGGGISSVKDAENLIAFGCDKVVINSLIHEKPKVFSEIISIFGSSSVVGSVQYSNKKKETTYYKMARESTKLDLSDTLKKYIDMGCGEILITEINNDGRYTGLDKELLNIINKYNKIPILIGGGFKGKSDIDIFYNHASAVVISSALHYKKVSLSDLLEQRNSLSYKNFNKK
tara:strand:- start:10946 stop:11689 length:744 start_codon:yes stop_codon:yes gene_type:complete